MSKTPRTNSALKLESFLDGFGAVETVQVEFVEQLETELTDANFVIKKQNENHQRYCMDADAKISQLETELAKAHELLLKTNQTHIENQQLRKDLDGERETNQRLTDELTDALKKVDSKQDVIDQLRLDSEIYCDRLKEARAEIERKNALIEQMREALNVLVASATPSGPLWHGSAEMQIAKAALSAAERGE